MLKRDLDSKQSHSPSIRRHAGKISCIFNEIENKCNVASRDSWEELKTSIKKLGETSSDFDSKLDRALLYSMVKLERYNAVNTYEDRKTAEENIYRSAKESELFISRLESYILENCPLHSILTRSRNFTLRQNTDFSNDSDRNHKDFKLGTFHLKLPSDVNRDTLIESLGQVFIKSPNIGSVHESGKVEFYVPFFLVPHSTQSNNYSFTFEMDFERPRIALVRTSTGSSEKRA
ncbi:MAG: hypothetical protein EOP48_00955 [Sphingobacteriales bacterium]|nr:MAG: hypothetical protein EOP48_00955 [Sphingobacteriales bacterium]